jgi:hypothetical protein
MIRREDRLEAIRLLDEFEERQPLLAGEWDDAWFDFCGGFKENYERIEESELEEMGLEFFDMWFALDRSLESGRRPVDHLLELERDVSAGARQYLQSLARTSVRLYEVADIVPGQSLLLREVFEGRDLRVMERTLSRMIEPHSLIAARIVTESVSGDPEIERGILPIPRSLRDTVLEQIARARDEDLEAGFSEIEIDRRVTPLYHQAWLSAFDRPVPQLHNTDGEPLVWTKLVFRVRDRARTLDALRTAAELHDEGDDTFGWSGTNPRGDDVSLAHLELKAERLFVQVNSLGRAERARALVERLAGDAIEYRISVQEDAEKMLEEAQSKALPPQDEALRSEEVEAALLEHYARHYQKWLDEEIPMLEGATPRAAAKSQHLRPKLIEAIKDLENMYYRALRDGTPAFDPYWMWQELGLSEDPRAPKPALVPPPLAHESLGRLVPGFSAIVRDLTKSLRKRSDFGDQRVYGDRELSENLAFQRYLRKTAVVLRESIGVDGAIADTNLIGFLLGCAVNHELHHKKTFWVGEGLTTMFDQTDADVPGELLRLPFASFALVFTDRHFLGIAERMLAIEEENATIAGQKLRVATIYVREAMEELDESGQDGAKRRALRVTFAFDAVGSDWPYIMSRVLPIDPSASMKEIVRAHLPADDSEGGELLLTSERLARLVSIVLNAILYATSAGVEAKPVRRTRPKTKVSARRAPEYTSEEVFHLPGHIDIRMVRNVAAIGRAPNGRQILHRFMVRGHWRRPNPDWSDQRMRWIEPYWKGPDMAVVIERSYRLKSGEVIPDDEIEASRPQPKDRVE